MDEQISGEIIRPGWKNQPPFERFLGAVVPPLCSSLLLFLKLPIAEELNSPACVRVWERRGDYCSPSRKSSCAHKGKYLCRASAWQPIACLFCSPVFFCFFCLAVRAFIIHRRLVRLPRDPPPLPLTLFSCTFSVSTAPLSFPHSLRKL